MARWLEPARKLRLPAGSHIISAMNSPASIKSAKKSRGRPPVDSRAVNVRMLLTDIERLDAWRARQDDAPSRPEAIRRLVEKALREE